MAECKQLWVYEYAQNTLFSYVCTYVCIYVYTHIHVYIHIHICTYTYTPTYVYTYAYIHIHIYIYMSIFYTFYFIFLFYKFKWLGKKMSHTHEHIKQEDLSPNSWESLPWGSNISKYDQKHQKGHDRHMFFKSHQPRSEQSPEQSIRSAIGCPSRGPRADSDSLSGFRSSSSRWWPVAWEEIPWTPALLPSKSKKQWRSEMSPSGKKMKASFGGWVCGRAGWGGGLSVTFFWLFSSAQ